MMSSKLKIDNKIIIWCVWIFYGGAPIVIFRFMIQFDEFIVRFSIITGLTVLALFQAFLYQLEAWIPHYCNI